MREYTREHFIAIISDTAGLDWAWYNQAETELPPVQLPDIGNQINWRFRLSGTYKGEQL